MFEEQHDDVKSLRFAIPHSEIPVLHTPESFADRPSSMRRKLPTPPLTDHSRVEEHVGLRKTMERLRTQKAFRRHLGGAQNSESDTDMSVVGMQNLMSITAPVLSGRRRVAANFPALDRLVTGSAVMSMTIPRGDVSAPAVSVIEREGFLHILC